MIVRELGASESPRWNAFVSAHPEATFFHRAEWKTVIERAFSHETHYLLVEDAGVIHGVLPLARMRSRLFGDALVSIPFGVYGGVLATDDGARGLLERAACQLAEALRVDFLELRNRTRRHAEWPCKDLYVTFRKPLAADPEENLKRIPRRQRAMVRRGMAAGLCAEIDDDTGRFYALYARSVRDLGTPVFSRRYFAILRDVFGRDCEVLTVLHAGRPVSSVMSFYFRDEVLPFYGGGTRQARAVAANDYMYWELMRRACERGVRVFDYGRSKRETGAYHFKKHWGFEPEPLYYECHLVKAKAIPQVNPLNPSYALWIGLWKRLPLSVANILGPRISKHLG